MGAEIVLGLAVAAFFDVVSFAGQRFAYFAFLRVFVAIVCERVEYLTGAYIGAY